MLLVFRNSDCHVLELEIELSRDGGGTVELVELLATPHSSSQLGVTRFKLSRALPLELSSPPLGGSFSISLLEA